MLLQPVEHSRALPAVKIDLGVDAVREHTRQVLQQAAAGNVGKRMYRNFLDQFEQRFYIDMCWSKQGFTQCCIVHRLIKICASHFKNVPDEGVAIGVRS